MSFLGQPKRRPINLGNKQQRTREDLLRKAEQDRLDRQNSRKQTDAAIVLQASARSKIAIRKERMKALREFESQISNYIDPNLMTLDFIYVCPVLDSAKNPASLMKRIKESVINDFVLSQLFISFNVLWNRNSPFLEHILGFYEKTTLYPVEIVHPLYRYATLHPTKFTEFYKYIFKSLASVQPEAIIKCATQGDTLLQLNVDLSDLQLSNTMIQLDFIPGDRVISLIQNFLPDPVHSASVIAQLVTLLPPRIGSETTDKLSPLFNQSFITAVLDLNPSPQQLTAFITPLLRSRNKTQLLMHLSITRPGLIKELWDQFVLSSSFTRAIDILDSNTGNSVPQTQFPQHELSLFIVMLELYSYRLIICGDAVMFDILNSEETKNVAQVLKGICALICTNKLGQVDLGSKGIFFAVMRQLHVKSERRNFLPKDFWLVPRLLPSYNLGDLQESLALVDYNNDDDYGDDDYEPEITIHAPPFLEVLKNAPFFINFMTRASIFNQFILEDKNIHRPIYETFFGDGVKTYRIDRESMVDDTAEAFHELLPDNGIKTKLKFTVFSNDEPEPGIDGGGLTKEVLTSVCREVFVDQTSVSYSDLFTETPDHTLYPNPKYRVSNLSTSKADDIGKRYQFLGLIVGKCLHEGIMIDVDFSPLFLQKWAGSSAAKSSFDDFYLLDPEMYASMLKLSQYDGDVEDLALDFTVDDGSGIVELKPNGGNIAVTNKNKLEYIHLLSDYRLNKAIRFQTMWFLRGITYFISPNWLKMFSAREVHTLISGQSKDFDTEDLRNHSDAFGFAMDHYVEYFWDVVREMTAEERSLLLKFVTSVPRGPLLGFSKLIPKFALRSAGRTDERLPTASTCVNLLKLPEYSSKEVLREKLLYAINSNSGFDLS